MTPRRARRSRSRILAQSALLAALLLLLPLRSGAVLQSLEGTGNFGTSVDVVNRWRDEATLDVAVLVGVANADLSFDREAEGWLGRLRIEVELTSLEGETVRESRPLRTQYLDETASLSPTLRQVFGIVLPDVPFREGRIEVRVFDVNERKRGLLNQLRKQLQVSVCSGAWAAGDGPRAADGFALEDPLFLVHAPLDTWRPGVMDAADRGGSLYDYAHPSRRYGLEQDRLQVFIPVWPPLAGADLEGAPPRLRVGVTSLDLALALTDTITFDNVGRAALAAGRPAGLFYELDVNLLPEGSFLLSLAPLEGKGRGALVGFDVIWRLDALGRSASDLVGEGRTVLQGAQLDAFLAASGAEKQAILNAFWEGLNPDPASPVNEVYLEFQYRKAYVREYLGGIDETGPRDPRGEIFLALGPPDAFKVERMPMNFRDQDDARINVFSRFAPDREGTMARGNSGSADPEPYSENDAIPQPWSHRAENQRVIAQKSASHLMAFELWEYDQGGKPLWPNRFTQSGMGQRFLFVDRTGTGDYTLESSNILQGEE